MKKHSLLKKIGNPAFTLIELLIVVAIIAILAAIAVPNFLEAQTRSKVSRVQADFRTLATAIESYFVDKNSYPYDQDDQINSPPPEDGFRLLTTPISYFSSGRSLSDPFSNPYLTGNDQAAPHYQLASGVDPARRPGRTNPADPRVQVQQAWLLFSLGPDNVSGVPAPNGGPGQSLAGTGMSNDDWPCFLTTPATGSARPSNVTAPYDPTNGTLSIGNIYRFGGDYGSGDWTIEDIDHNLYGARATYP
jgi:prepilin-type N-terminal cleavage/methylation domain-containing protein